MFRRHRSADPDAFSAEVLTFLEPLYATALRLTRNRADAQDLVQDTLVKAFRFADRFEAGTNLKAWLYTILHNTWRNRRRDAARRRLLTGGGRGNRGLPRHSSNSGDSGTRSHKVSPISACPSRL